ncbi:MAG: SDR family NAD(P)-dependent oxidoreductase [Anaeromyxobacteraceae bacterium]
MANAEKIKKVALVTGASAGIGKAIARRLLKDGWTVYGGARRVEQMGDLRGEGAKLLRLDVTEEESMKAAGWLLPEGGWERLVAAAFRALARSRAGAARAAKA